ncbi:unnamed protein product [Miscanthus lutarioriparius]|uniref:Protein kinase domain-containing protein n=1 Tax=Miscanthus lutarioriparius TaxID=422564 RepID=A0A811Q8H5_9POAL|nr:unnamed protein product [Miscanthus lutarioriparius]
MGSMSQKIKIFTEDEITSITSNYSTLIGKGGFGEVYRGILDADNDLVAVKRYIRQDLREEFMEEVNIHSMMNHNNVVKLIGYCVGESTLMLVTEYISNGNLDDILHRSETPIPLDFTTTLKGSMGYMDPVYFHEGCLTPRSDVYSFGIVLLELVTRKRAKYGDVSLIPTFNKACAKGKGLRELFDAAIAEKDDMKILKELWKLAAQCLSLNIHTRPQMNEVAKRLRMLKKDLKGSPQSILATQSIWAKQYTQSSRPPSFKKKLSFFKGNTSYSKILSELCNRHLSTEGWSYLKLPIRILSKFWGCLESQTIAFLYEYIAKGSISDILGSQEDFPIDLRMRIAIKTAEALQYLHSSETGIIGHGSVSASTILLDNNFVPKLTEFSRACMLFKKSETAGGVISSSLLEKVLNNDPSRYGSVLMNMESDVYKIGGVLMALISRDKDSDHDDLLAKFTKAYESEETGKALFDKDITAEEDIILLEELGRLALKCTILNADKIFMRPTMKEVADELRRIRRSWKEHRTTEAATHVTTETTTDVVPEEPRLPNLMRHMFGYRRISTSDPIRVC